MTDLMVLRVAPQQRLYGMTDLMVLRVAPQQRFYGMTDLMVLRVAPPTTALRDDRSDLPWDRPQ